ncbi:DUF4166 domain-containing protein [Sphingomonas sp.]|jgi:hypothetical protein|uniref:DUF4166 domain-containing protein n=1 Tax=Sphingomonas sp. TaxID=28214 RepID=UPI002ED97D1F
MATVWHEIARTSRGTLEGGFERLLGREAWLALPGAVRERFLRRIETGDCVNYVGRVMECRMSRAGRVLAQLARIIGAPLPLGTDIGVAASVSVTSDDGRINQYWTRQYGRRHGFPQVIHSAKRFAGPTGLEEYIGHGIGIALRLRVEDGTLLFEGDHYFLRLFGLRLRLPGWAQPGRLTVGHRDLGDGRFVFSLDLVHPLFGELIHQCVVFADSEGP